MKVQIRYIDQWLTLTSKFSICFTNGLIASVYNKEIAKQIIDFLWLDNVKDSVFEVTISTNNTNETVLDSIALVN